MKLDLYLVFRWFFTSSDQPLSFNMFSFVWSEVDKRWRFLGGIEDYKWNMFVYLRFVVVVWLNFWRKCGEAHLWFRARKGDMSLRTWNHKCASPRFLQKFSHTTTTKLKQTYFTCNQQYRLRNVNAYQLRIKQTKTCWKKEVGHVKQKISEKQDTSPVSSLDLKILEKAI
jgi:hypothetical protein